MTLWQSKTVISLLLQCVWPPILTVLWFKLRGSHPWSKSILFGHRLPRSRDILKLYTCTTKELMATNLTGWRLTIRGSSPYSHMTFNQMVLLGHVTVWKIFMSTFTRLFATKLGKILTWGKRFNAQTLKSSRTSCYISSRYL